MPVAAIAAIAGAYAGGVIAAGASWAGTAMAIGAGIGMTIGGSIDQQKAAAAQKSAQKKAAAAQATAGLVLAGQELELTKSEMMMQTGQRKIQGLMDALQTPPAPRIFTLPSAAPESTFVDKINAAIHSFVTGG